MTHEGKSEKEEEESDHSTTESTMFANAVESYRLIRSMKLSIKFHIFQIFEIFNEYWK